MKHNNATKVVFRCWKDGDVLALFPELLADNHGQLCDSYEHVGQHGAADYHGCLQQTRPAKPKEYVALEMELKQIGYTLRIIQRYQRAKR